MRDMMRPYTGTFGMKEARHLLCRAGFGATYSEVTAHAKLGLRDSLALVLGSGVIEDSRYRNWQHKRAMSARVAIRGEIEALQGAWLLSAVASPFPLQEKMALFWHDHFATANAKVDDLVAMNNQMSLFLHKGLGRFRELLGAVAKDPAMLVFLDGSKNSKENPNENFAREVMELFTLGIGHYQERDIKEAARAFTGWQLASGQFRFVKNAHDSGSKSVLGSKGNLGGDDVLDVCLSQKHNAEFLAAKLCRFYLGKVPPRQQIIEVAEALRQEKLHMRKFLARFFASELFFDSAYRIGRIKSPVEFVVSALRSLDAKFSATQLAKRCRAMGQELFNPPGVAGWPEGRDWINSATIAARYRFVTDLAKGKDGILKVRSKLPERTQLDELSFVLLGMKVKPPRRFDALIENAGFFLAQPEAQLG